MRHAIDGDDRMNACVQPLRTSFCIEGEGHATGFSAQAEKIQSRVPLLLYKRRYAVAARRHSFGRPRLSHDAFNLSNDTRAFSSRRFHPLPPPTGVDPFHLDLADVLSAK